MHNPDARAQRWPNERQRFLEQLNERRVRDRQQKTNLIRLVPAARGQPQVPVHLKELIKARAFVFPQLV